MDEAALKENFGRRVRSFRHLRDWTQKRLAEKAGLSPEYLGEIERGEASPSFEVIGDLVEALDVNPEDLFHFEQLGGL